MGFSIGRVEVVIVGSGSGSIVLLLNQHLRERLRQVLNEHLIEVLDVIVKLIGKPVLSFVLFLGNERVLPLDLGGFGQGNRAGGHSAPSSLVILGSGEIFLGLVETSLEAFDLLLLGFQGLGLVLALLEQQLVVFLQRLDRGVLHQEFFLLLFHSDLVLLKN